MRLDIKAIIHPSSPALVSFSIAQQIPNANIIPRAKYICGPIGYQKYACPVTNSPDIKNTTLDIEEYIFGDHSK